MSAIRINADNFWKTEIMSEFLEMVKERVRAGHVTDIDTLNVSDGFDIQSFGNFWGLLKNAMTKAHDATDYPFPSSQDTKDFETQFGYLDRAFHLLGDRTEIYYFIKKIYESMDSNWNRLSVSGIAKQPKEVPEGRDWRDYNLYEVGDVFFDEEIAIAPLAEANLVSYGVSGFFADILQLGYRYALLIDASINGTTKELLVGPSSSSGGGFNISQTTNSPAGNGRGLRLKLRFSAQGTVDSETGFFTPLDLPDFKINRWSDSLFGTSFLITDYKYSTGVFEIP